MADASAKNEDVRVRIDGAKLAELLASPQGAIAKELLKLGLQIEARAKDLCPVDTGRLRSSITSALEEEGDTIVAVIGTDVEYAPFIEFGTQRMEAQPFLVPAAYAVLQSRGGT